MRISRLPRERTRVPTPAPNSDSDSTDSVPIHAPDQNRSPARGADVVLVVVHGMGQATPGSTLLEWAEPILGRVDWLAKYADVVEPGLRERLSERGWSPGLTIVDSVVSGAETPHIIADATWSVTTVGADGALEVRRPRRRIAVLEARWSESFVPMTRSEVFNWGARFLWRVLWRMFVQFARTLVKVPWLGTARLSSVVINATRATQPTASRHTSPPTARSLARRVFSGLLALFGIVLSVGLAAILLALGAILTVILPLLSPLMLIPFVKKHVQNVVDALVAFVGDVGTWRERPLRAASMRSAVQDRIVEADGMLADGGEIVVLAHSEGAAISAETLFTDMAPLQFNVTQLHTVGAANTLLGLPGSGFGAPREGRWVADWSANGGLPSGSRLRWHNYWAIWDPFAAGPLGDNRAARSTRWKGSYVLGAADSAFGPAEHAVHNTSIPLTDHQSYAANTAQVIDPVARVLLGPELQATATDAASASVAQSMLIRRSRGLNLISSIIVALMLPFMPGVQSAVISALEWVADGLNGVLDWLSIDVKLEVSGILNPEGTQLAAWPTVAAVALAAALLIWLNSLYANRAERAAVWDRLSAFEVQQWYRRELLVRACYSLGAALAVALVVAANAPKLLLAAAIGLGIAVLCTLLAPNLRALPFTVDENPDLELEHAPIDNADR